MSAALILHTPFLMRYAVGYYCQILISINSTVFTRCKVYDGEWGSWRNISDGGNADTVDGRHASDFAKAIKTAVKTGTTDALGDLILWDVSENKIPVCIKGPDATRCVIIIGYSGTKYMVNITDITTQNTVVNTEVSLTIYYTEI